MFCSWEARRRRRVLQCPDEEEEGVKKNIPWPKSCVVLFSGCRSADKLAPIPKPRSLLSFSFFVFFWLCFFFFTKVFFLGFFFSATFSKILNMFQLFVLSYRSDCSLELSYLALFMFFPLWKIVDWHNQIPRIIITIITIISCSSSSSRFKQRWSKTGKLALLFLYWNRYSLSLQKLSCRRKSPQKISSLVFRDQQK